jgi:hypothetical protein
MMAPCVAKYCLVSQGTVTRGAQREDAGGDSSRVHLFKQRQWVVAGRLFWKSQYPSEVWLSGIVAAKIGGVMPGRVNENHGSFSGSRPMDEQN